MRPLKVLVCVVSVLAVACGGAIAKPERNANEPVLGNSGLMLSLEDLKALEERAMEGSADAANTLGAHYSVMSVNDTEAWRWYVIGAENGNAGSMYSLWVIGERSKDPLIKIRAQFWLRRSAELGNERAARVLQSKASPSK